MHARPPHVCVLLLALTGCVVLAAEAPQSNLRLAEKCTQDVVTPGVSLLGRLSKAMTDATPADLPVWQQTAVEADQLSNTGWPLMVKAREHWRATEAESDFQFYLSIADAVSAADHLSMVPRTRDERHLEAARARFAASQQAARLGAQLAQLPQVSRPTTAPPSTPTTVPAQPSVVPASDLVYLTAQGSKFHRAGCRYLKGGGSAMSRSEALAAGYIACKVCGP